MTTTKSKEPTVFTPDHIGDEHWGQGGSFIIGTDGKRTRVPDPVEAEADAVPTDTAPATKKGK